MCLGKQEAILIFLPLAFILKQTSTCSLNAVCGLHFTQVRFHFQIAFPKLLAARLTSLTLTTPYVK